MTVGEARNGSTGKDSEQAMRSAEDNLTRGLRLLVIPHLSRHPSPGERLFSCRETEPLDGVGRLSSSQNPEGSQGNPCVTLCRTTGGVEPTAGRRCLFDSTHTECQVVAQRAHPAADSEIQSKPDAKVLEEEGRGMVRCTARDCGSSWSNFVSVPNTKTGP